MINFTAEGAGGDFFRVLAPFMPPSPPDTRPPFLWGDEDYVRERFAGRVQTLQLTRQEYLERAPSPQSYFDLFRKSFGPMVAILGSLAHQPAQRAALERNFLDFVARWNRGGETGEVAIPYEYLLVIARR
jgi:2-polyprenyl-6-hydroxyphenyl methylase/3-demethylubiquinone-9 3-methyltransferase